MTQIQPSELIINSRGAIYHLNIRPEDIADTIILVGDQDRVKTISAYFDTIDTTSNHREFVTHTGTYKGKRITVLSTGIGTDNIDIVVNELDALANIDFKTRRINAELRSLTFVRLGTSGAIQANIPVGSIVKSEMAIGFDGLLNFYANRDSISHLSMEAAFIEHTHWNKNIARPYFVTASEHLLKKFAGHFMSGITISAPGFYGPQGRVLRIPLVDGKMNEKIESFSFEGKKITNFEMEGSAIYGLSKHLQHEALTICAIIANRATKKFSNDYHEIIEKMVKTSLDVLTS
ncbi:MAG: nucleoside phosphorylase [Bacteroidales bacterium]|nr:nucleoside phosphorylase [Bacteroidales bacterium]MCF8458611.1 nucleoside phosphorylase [Bacteroidales bacterium]